jgi:hypothetical protein
MPVMKAPGAVCTLVIGGWAVTHPKHRLAAKKRLGLPDARLCGCDREGKSKPCYTVFALSDLAVSGNLPC